MFMTFWENKIRLKNRTRCKLFDFVIVFDFISVVYWFLFIFSFFESDSFWFGKLSAKYQRTEKVFNLRISHCRNFACIDISTLNTHKSRSFHHMHAHNEKVWKIYQNKVILFSVCVCVCVYVLSVNLWTYRKTNYYRGRYFFLLFWYNIDKLNGIEFVCLKFRAKIKLKKVKKTIKYCKRSSRHIEL